MLLLFHLKLYIFASCRNATQGQVPAGSECDLNFVEPNFNRRETGIQKEPNFEQSNNETGTKLKPIFDLTGCCIAG